MRPITSGGDSFRSVDRYLLPYEQQLIAIRRHPAILLGSGLVVLAGLGAVVVLTSLLKFSGDALLAVWLAWSFLLLRLIWKVINWLAGYCIVTSDKERVIRGFLARDVAMIPSSGLSTLTLSARYWAMLSGTGTLFWKSTMKPLCRCGKSTSCPIRNNLFWSCFQSFAAICLTRRIAGEDCRR